MKSLYELTGDIKDINTILVPRKPPVITHEKIIAAAKKSGFVASVGKIDKSGNYIPYINALAKHVPIEWLSSLIEEINHYGERNNAPST